ncbi:hypothetical protein D3C77_732740 [compost metagenome]
MNDQLRSAVYVDDDVGEMHRARQLQGDLNNRCLSGLTVRLGLTIDRVGVDVVTLGQVLP